MLINIDQHLSTVINVKITFHFFPGDNANSPIGYNIAYFRNSYGIDIFPDVCVKKIINPPRLNNAQHMIISELNILLLAKGKMYNIDGLLSQILTFSLN